MACEPAGDCSGRTHAFALPAADALGTVDVSGDLHIHGTCPFTLLAVYASASVQVHLVEAEAVEQGVKGSQGAEVFAEGPVDHHGGNQDRRQHQCLPAKQQPCRLPQAWVGQEQGDAAAQGSGGADGWTIKRRKLLEMNV